MGTSIRNRLLAVVLGGVFYGTLTPLYAAETLEEVVVTGSYIKGTPEDAELPVDVLRREDLEDQGNPSIIDMVKNLSVASGTIGETNQFQTNGGQSNEGAATINLRGLGAARTLVLLNGRRHVATESIGVDISAMPQFAIGRIEVLKDGAAALYGSDAIGGVVNFITREDIVGFEIGGSYTDIDGGGDQDINIAWGTEGDGWNFMIAGEWSERDEIPFKTRDWAVRPFSENQEGGWSSISGPANIYFPGAPGGPAVIPDPRCEDLGAWRDSLNSCGFQFTFFDNLVEKQENQKLFAQFNYDISDTMSLNIEAMVTEIDVPEWKTSPAYPPQSLFGSDRWALPDHPGLVRLRADYPSLPQASIAIPISRALGVLGLNGQPAVGTRTTDTERLAIGLEGTLSDDIDYNISLSWSERERYVETPDMYIERMGFAMRGFGGPNCDRATAIANYTPGQNGCEYYNPFSNSIDQSAVNGFVNPDFDPALANSQSLKDWLFSDPNSTSTNNLMVFEAVFTGQLDWALDGGNVGWAVGAQSRRERFTLELSDIANRDINPCPWTDPLAIALGFTTTLDCPVESGRLAFLAASGEERTSRTVYGTFAELNLPFSDDLNMQLAVRFEDYGGNVGTTIDPKVAVSWNFSEGWTLRGSASSTFRGPPQSYLEGVATALQFNAAVNAFKAVDITGNPDLEPESALTTNLGLIYQNDSFYGSIDYWRYDFDDPIQTESATQVVNAYIANQCADGEAGAGSTICAALRGHIFPVGTTVAGLQRTVVNIINGSNITTSGVDFNVNYDFYDVVGGTLTLGLTGTYNIEYESDDFVDIGGALLAPGGDFTGYLNDGNNPFQSMPELKYNVSAKWATDGHRVNLIARHITDYEDATAVDAFLETVDDHTTFDLHYINTMFDNLTISASVVNLTDEDPPQAQTDLNYDPYTHNPYGRMFKIGLRYSFDMQ